MLESLITNKTRLKLLLKFFLNNQTTSYLRNLESEFGESTNAIRIELNRMESAGLLNSSLSGNKKMFQANDQHPLYTEINSIVRKTVGLDQVVEKVTSNIGDLHEAYLIGDLAKGKDCQVIDLLLIGDNIDKPYVSQLIEKAEELIKRKIRFLALSLDEKVEYMEKNTALLLWNDKTT